MKRILCLKFPGWPLQRFVAARPELRPTLATRGIVIHAADPRRGELVRLCSAQAWKCGVRPGMPLAEATALFPRDDDVLLAQHDPAADLKLLTKIAAWCERYSPLVGWETIAGRSDRNSVLPSAPEPEALYLDITSIGVLFGGEQKLAEDLLAELSRRGFVAHVGIAETIGAAWAVAGSGDEAIIPRDGIEPALALLPITALRLSADNVATLHELGVITIAELMALPRQGLTSRFGPGLLVRLDQALGQAQELIQPARRPPVFQAEWLLEHPTRRREEIELILAQLVERVAGQLAQRQEGAIRLSCRLDAAGQKPVVFTVGLYRPTASLKHLLELVQMQLERLRLPGAIGRVGLAAVLTSPLETHQSQLFDDLSLRNARAQALLLDRLSSRLGAEAVLRPLLVPDALPEREAKLVPAGRGWGTRDQGPGKRRRKILPGPESPVPGPPSPSHRPLVLLSPPREIETTAIAPEGPPARLRYAGRMLRVSRHWGPERIETAWWRGRSVRRDYYRVETTSGQRFWLFRELREGTWFLHGVFE